MAMRVSIDGSFNGQHTLADLYDFLATCERVGMPRDAKLSGKTKILGTGPLKTVTAVWDTSAPSAALPMQPQPSASDKPYIPGLAEDTHPTTPMVAVPPPVGPPDTTTA
jgi:hypothetical protein